MSFAEYAVAPRCVMVHDPVAAGAFRSLDGIDDPADLERDWLFRTRPQEALYAAQHRILVGTLRKRVDEVIYLADLIGDAEVYGPALSNPNQVFTRDSVITLPWAPDGYIAPHMKCELRRPETAATELALQRLGLRRLARVPPHLYLEGGDVIPFEREGRRTLLVGHGPRTSFEAAEFLRDALVPEHADEIIAIELAEWRMNLDGGLVPVAEDVVIAEPESIRAGVLLDGRGRHDLDVLGMLRDLGAHIIATTRDESVYAQACNCVCLGHRSVIYYDLCERICTLLMRHDVEPLCVPGSELVKGRGGPRCMTRPIYQQPRRTVSCA